MRSSDCIFCPGYDGVFRLYAGTENFKDGIAESRRILKGKWPRAVLLLVVLNLFLILGLVLTYGAVMVIAAVLVTLFAKAYTATAVMATVSYRIEWLLLFIGSAVAVVNRFWRNDGIVSSVWRRVTDPGK